MIVGVLVDKKMYLLVKYLFTMMIVVGVALFMYKYKAGMTSGASDSLTGVGEALLLMGLTCVCDSLTGAVQERMKLEHKTKSGHMMMAMNKRSVVCLAVALAFTGEGLEFIQRYPAYPW